MIRPFDSKIWNNRNICTKRYNYQDRDIRFNFKYTWEKRQENNQQNFNTENSQWSNDTDSLKYVSSFRRRLETSWRRTTRLSLWLSLSFFTSSFCFCFMFFVNSSLSSAVFLSLSICSISSRVAVGPPSHFRKSIPVYFCRVPPTSWL